MGYEFHITRADSWLASTDHPIPYEEWASFAASHPQLVVDGSYVSPDLPGGSQPIYTWPSESQPSFIWWSGSIEIKGIADDDEARRIASLARALGARLVGDEDEEYEPA